MYDAKNESCEFVGDSRQEVIAKACQFFAVEEDQLTVSGFAPGEVYGLGGHEVIVARRKDAKPPRPSEGRGEGRGDRGSRGRGDRDRGGRGEGPGRGRGNSDRGRGRGRDREASRREPDRGPGRGRDEEETRQARPVRSSEASVGTARGKLGEVGSYLLGILERMELGPFEIAENQEGGLLVFEVTGAAAADLAQGDGRPVDALQLLVNQAASRLSDEPPRVVVDVEGDADAREAHLSRLAQRVARRARDGERAVALDPMNSRDRRMIHLALRDDEGIATMSMGEGRYRQVVVVPEGAPEFEEAQRESRSAADRSDS